MQAYCSLDPCEQISVKFQLNHISFIEIIFQNIVRKMVAILSRTQYWKWNGEYKIWLTMKMIDMGILTLLTHLVQLWQTSKSAILWRHFGEENFAELFCAFICRYDATNGHRFTFVLSFQRYQQHKCVNICIKWIERTSNQLNSCYLSEWKATFSSLPSR